MRHRSDTDSDGMDQVLQLKVKGTFIIISLFHYFIFQNIIKTSRIAFMLLLTFFKKCERNWKISGSFLEFLWFLRFFSILFDIFRIYKIHETFLGFKGLLSDFSEKWTRFFWGIYPSSWKLVLMYFYWKDVEITFCKIINQNRGGERNYWLCWRQKKQIPIIYISISLWMLVIVILFLLYIN